MKNETPSELKEQSIFVNWCREMGLKVCATAQNTYTQSWKALNENRVLGVVRGLPDLVVILDGKYRKDGTSILFFIEMKRRVGGKVSIEQREWIKKLSKCMGVEANICNGSEHAINYLKSFMEVEPPLNDSFINSLKK